MRNSSRAKQRPWRVASVSSRRPSAGAELSRLAYPVAFNQSVHAFRDRAAPPGTSTNSNSSLVTGAPKGSRDCPAPRYRYAASRDPSLSRSTQWPLPTRAAANLVVVVNLLAFSLLPTPEHPTQLGPATDFDQLPLPDRAGRAGVAHGEDRLRIGFPQAHLDRAVRAQESDVDVPI